MGPEHAGTTTTAAAVQPHAPSPGAAHAVHLPAPLSVGAVGDPLEADADARAGRALARLERLPRASGRRPARRSTSLVVGRLGRAGGELDRATGDRIEELRAGGQELDGDVRRRMERAFGTSLGRVRLHADDEAARLSAGMSATAFTSGQDVFLGHGVDPGDPAGERVLAHELAHTLQPDQQPGTAPLRRYIEMGKYDGTRREDQAWYHAALGTGQGSRLPAVQIAIAKWMIESRHVTYRFSNKRELVETFTKATTAFTDAVARTGALVHVGPFTGPEDALTAWVPPARLSVPESERDGATTFQVIRQHPQERGDMHDVRAAAMLDERIRVILVVDDLGQLGDAAQIVDYYRGLPWVPFVIVGRGVPPPWSMNLWKTTSATAVMQREARARPDEISAELRKAATGGTEKVYTKLYDDVLDKTFHFDQLGRNDPIALINFRVSGHGAFTARQPSHPELDTGTAGFTQLWDAARDAGYRPIPVGEVSAAALAGCEFPKGTAFDPARHPHLIEYYKQVAAVVAAADAAASPKPAPAAASSIPGSTLAKPPGRAVRAARGPTPAAAPPAPLGPKLPARNVEYGLIARVADRFPRARAIGMRSGGLDAIAHAGIPVLSLDVKPTPEQVGELGDAYGHPEGWKRAAKREQIQPGHFHQAFVDVRHPGAGGSAAWLAGLPPHEALAALSDRNWPGEFSETDRRRIVEEITTSFGPLKEESDDEFDEKPDKKPDEKRAVGRGAGPTPRSATEKAPTAGGSLARLPAAKDPAARPIPAAASPGPLGPRPSSSGSEKK
ncbi:eCIS core domain-containing protein [Cellulomonas composti]|uniref:eCIS core domain-containing protein n=1 Tax=Cellulomonas composti TaxID=266130 RepID=A0A511J7W8_9CELL|nr:DUF4157 domain-containing protein [Cellulomonas composti]GEL94092.1 hypothetical protein CCO02nite_07500 [Cellulomonas composti]